MFDLMMCITLAFFITDSLLYFFFYFPCSIAVFSTIASPLDVFKLACPSVTSLVSPSAEVLLAPSHIVPLGSPRETLDLSAYVPVDVDVDVPSVASSSSSSSATTSPELAEPTAAVGGEAEGALQGEQQGEQQGEVEEVEEEQEYSDFRLFDTIRQSVLADAVVALKEAEAERARSLASSSTSSLDSLIELPPSMHALLPGSVELASANLMLRQVFLIGFDTAVEGGNDYFAPQETLGDAVRAVINLALALAHAQHE